MKILSTVWKGLDGYKLLAGLLITFLAFLSTWIPEIMAAAHADPALIAKVTGGIVSVIGILHRIYKVAYGEEAK